MASANIYSLENPPEFEFVVNNKGTKDINVKDRFKRVRAKDSRPTPTSLSEVIVHDTLTKDGKFNFLIYDNHKKNRILVFVSPIRLKMLSESD